jgi:shikimate kinase
VSDPAPVVGVRGADDPIVDPVHKNVSGPVVVLVGVPGAGKSTVGRALAARLGVGYRDTDADVEGGTGRPIADIFVESGEVEFRRLESAAVAAALAEHPGVLALGGGAVMDPTTRTLLAGRPVVWLRVGLAAASQRAGLGVARPVLLGNVRAQMKALMDSRAPLYAEVARLTVDTDGLSVDEVADRIIAELGLPDPSSGPVEAGSSAGHPATVVGASQHTDAIDHPRAVGREG